MKARWIALAALAAAALAVLLDGAAPFGRALLGAGQAGAAASLLDDPDWRGAALYRAGDWDGAAAAFRDAGDAYHLGLAETRAGRYAAALEAFDRARAGGDRDAAANFDLVAAHYGGLALDPEAAISWAAERDRAGATLAAPTGQGQGRAAASGDEATNAGALLGLPELESRGRLGVRRVFDDKFIVANERWLEQLSDVPGEYLAARIAHEAKRRAALGLAPPPPEDPR
ncbi:hypothetical protein [Roseivivax sp. CAU 1761]